LSDQVFQATRRADHDVNTALQSLDLASLGDTANNLGRKQTGCSRQGLHCAVNLEGKFPGGRQDQAQWSPAWYKTLGGLSPWSKALDEGCTKGNGFSGAGVAARQDVTSGEGVWNRGGLDGKRGRRPHGGEDIDKGLSDAKVQEALRVVAFCGNRNSGVALLDDIVAVGSAA